MKPLIFRFVCISVSIFTGALMYELKSFDALTFTVCIISGFLFIIDFFTWVTAISSNPYNDTSMGSITYILFKPKPIKK